MAVIEQFPCTGLTVCVVNFNGERFLEESLRSLCEGQDALEEILLIDNGSEDKSIELVEKLFPAVTIIALGENRGPGAARNIGLQRARCDRILFMDNDVEVAPGCADALCEKLDEQPEAALAMPSVHYHHCREKIQFDGADCHYLGLMILHNSDVTEGGGVRPSRKMDTVVTSCFMIDRARGVEDLRFDESYVFNYEDFDFGLRTRIRGREIVAVPEARCYHRGGTEGLSYRPWRRYPQRRVRYLIRNRWQTVLKCYQVRTLLLLLPMLLAYEFFQFAGVLKKGWGLEWLRSVFWIAGHFPKIISKRRAVQTDRRTPDAMILKGGKLPFLDNLAVGSVEKGVLRVLDTLASWYWQKVGRLV